MDKIIINELKIFAYHGVNEEEKIDGQEFEFDVIMYIDLSVPCDSDNIEDTVSYSAAAKVITKAVTENSYNLLEKLAKEVCNKLFENFTEVKQVDIIVKKPNAPIKSVKFSYVGVAISKTR